jgi:hypothetical protein
LLIYLLLLLLSLLLLLLLLLTFHPPTTHPLILLPPPGKCTTIQVTSPDILHNEFCDVAPGSAHVHSLLASIHPDAALITVLDGHPASLSWLGGVCGHRVVPLGVNRSVYESVY